MKLPRQIYVIQHTPTKKRYVGSSSNVKTRYQQHMSALKRGAHPVRAMQSDFDHYGGEYTLTILGEINTSAERELEYGWMLRYATYDPKYGYNVNDPAVKRQAAEGSIWRDPKIIARFLEA